MAHPPSAPPARPAAEPPADARIAAAADAWKRKLLDLSKRNRALNFRPAKVSTVAVIDERPAEVFRQIVLLERAMRFRGTKEGELFPDGEAGDTEEGEYDLGGTDFAPYDASRIDEH